MERPWPVVVRCGDVTALFRIQRGDGGVQEYFFHGVGRWRPGQDPPSVEALLSEHPRFRLLNSPWTGSLVQSSDTLFYTSASWSRSYFRSHFCERMKERRRTRCPVAAARVESSQCVLATLCIVIVGLIFVVDSNDRERIDEAREELSKMVRLLISLSLPPMQSNQRWTWSLCEV